jgi:hypothetical protein
MEELKQLAERAWPLFGRADGALGHFNDTFDSMSAQSLALEPLARQVGPLVQAAADLQALRPIPAELAQLRA